ncbi:hypothetical protein B4923_18885 [Brenneria roseae subsp. americana]|uniref:Uncharacterized protein n=1 Tax=Brenneria roseae subsp. americana TaxID=1508507 RepID=A0A2U1TK34_9GAMM|nr:hypothetical protein [Brenneria roseae]PWC09781.1 hypothetical protein B4923_18885 [Brenneria roseae subsp. americana]
MAVTEDHRWPVKLVDAVTRYKGSGCSIMIYLLFFLLVTLLAAKVFPAGGTAFRTVAGMFFGAYAMGGRTASRYLWLIYRYRQSVALDAWLGCVFLLFLGFGSWWIGWEGQRTGLPFGIGVFISVVCYQLSIGEFYERTFDREIVAVSPSQEPPVDKEEPPMER